jgi:protein-tyrosine phosphatase
MSWLNRCAVLFACVAFGCEAVDEGARIGHHEPAHPTLAAPSGGKKSGESGESGEGANGGSAANGDSGGTSGSAGSEDEAADSGTQATCPQHPWVLVPDLVNARDVGGTPLSQGGSVACGSIFRGPPLALTSVGCERARALRLRTVIDLRVDSERSSLPDSTCTEADFVSAPLPIPYGLAAADYLADLNADAIATVFHTVGDPERYPIYIHCTWGRDRTGVVAALLLLTLGVSPREVMAEYLLSQPTVGAYPDALQAVLDELEAQGGPESFLTSIGISPQEIAVIRSHTVD